MQRDRRRKVRILPGVNAELPQENAKRRIDAMLVVEKGKREKWSVGGEEPQGGAVGSFDRLGFSPKYVIARRRNGALEPLRATLPSGAEALPVFAAEQAAWRYLRSETPGAGWYVRESHDGELASMLMSLCRGIKSILLDPAPATAASVGAGALLDRKGFLEACLGTGAACRCSARAEHLVGGADFAPEGCPR